MTKFFFSHIFQHKIRSISMIASISILCLVIFCGIFLEKNISSAIEYYASHGNNEKRITLSQSQNLLNIFHSDEGMSEKLVAEIQNDDFFENIQIFRLVHIPVSAKFGFFSFSLESDIPVFSVTDSALSGAENPIGMSRTMLDLYNTQFAGSSGMFPQMREGFLKWQKIEFTFGKSKIFQSSNTIAKPIVGKITTINNDFPWLWLILRESVVKEKMQEIGFSLGKPYKIVGYVKNLDNKAKIEEKYKHITTRFEIDEIHETRQKIAFIGNIFHWLRWGIIVIFAIFFAFLLGGYFRERQHIFKMISLFGLKSIKSYVLTIGEPIFFAFFGIIFGGIFTEFLLNFAQKNLSQILESKWIFFPILSLQIGEIFCISLFIFSGIFLFIIFLEIWSRRKYKFS